MSFGLTPLVSALPSGHLREFIPGGAAGTEATILRMQDLVTQGKRDFRIRKLAGQLIQGGVSGIPKCPPKDYYCYAEAAHRFCRDKITYVFDPNGVELIESPWSIVESGIADCDSIVMLMSTLCETMGFPCRFVTIKADTQRPDEFSHVFMEVKIPKRGWVASDPTQPERPFGWSAPAKFPRKNWPASKDAPEDSRETDAMAGLGQAILGARGHIVGVQATPGVLVGNEWEFRREPALITATPEQMELAPMMRAGTTIPGTLRPEFFLASEADAFIDQEQAARPQVRVEMRGMGALPPASMGKWLLAAGLIGLLIWGSRKR